MRKINNNFLYTHHNIILTFIGPDVKINRFNCKFVLSKKEENFDMFAIILQIFLCYENRIKTFD
jgi:hypothetical protein